MKPVCWARQDGVIAFHEQKAVDSEGYKWYPLYLLRELTDEEIRKVADEVFKDYKNWHHYQIDFAKAVIKKAGEK